MVHALQDSPLVERMLKLVTAQNFALFEYFERVHFLCVLFFDEEHLAVAALPDDLDRAEVAHTDLAGARLRPITELFHLVD